MQPANSYKHPFFVCPNHLRTLSGPDDEFGRVLNGVKGKKKVAEILGVDPPHLSRNQFEVAGVDGQWPM